MVHAAGHTADWVMFQDYLERINTAFLSGDYASWRDAVSLPLVLVTRNGTTIIETDEALQRDFEMYTSEFRIHGITDMIRVIRSVDRIEDDQMTGVYTTHILRNADEVVEPYQSTMTLRRENGDWKMTTVMNAIGHLNWHRRIKPDLGGPTVTPTDKPLPGDEKND